MGWTAGGSAAQEGHIQTSENVSSAGKVLGIGLRDAVCTIPQGRAQGHLVSLPPNPLC